MLYNSTYVKLWKRQIYREEQTSDFLGLEEIARKTVNQ